MKTIRTVSWFFQFLFLLASIFLAVPLSLIFSVPVMVFLWMSWLSEFLNRWLVIAAVVFMGTALAFLVHWSIGVGIAFLTLYFLLWSWLHATQLTQSMVVVSEIALPVLFLFVLSSTMDGTIRFWLFQFMLVVVVQAFRWWKRRVRVWSITRTS